MSDEPPPTITSLDALAEPRALVARFRAGLVANRHHWTLEDADGTVLAATRRTHRGGRLRRGMWQAVTLTGMDGGNDVHAELLGADEVVLARFSSVNADPPTVTVTDADGSALGRSRRDVQGKRLVLETAPDGPEVAALTTAGDGPWPVALADGTPVGALAPAVPGLSTSPDVLELLFPSLSSNQTDYARTMHLGIRRVQRYVLAREDGAATVAPLVALLPLLAGLSY
jgi:hypothetical protein